MIVFMEAFLKMDTFRYPYAETRLTHYRGAGCLTSDIGWALQGSPARHAHSVETPSCRLTVRADSLADSREQLEYCTTEPPVML